MPERDLCHVFYVFLCNDHTPRGTHGVHELRFDPIEKSAIKGAIAGVQCPGLTSVWRRV